MEYIQKHKKIVVLLILFVVGLAIYGNSFNNEFFWDDDDSIVNNIYIKDWQYLPNYFSENLIAGAGQITNYWRPVLLISFALDYSIWGLNTGAFHLTNILLHVLAAWLIFLLLIKLGKIIKVLSSKTLLILSFLVSLFFLIHPLQTEAVAYVAGRADSLSTVFSLLTIIFYLLCRLDKKKIKFFGLSLFFFILGLMTKEQVVLLPSLILIVELVFISNKINKASLIKVSKLIFPFFLILIIYFIMRLTVLDFNNILSGFAYSENYDSSIWQRLMTFCLVMVLYFKLLFVPLGLHMAREIPLITSFFSWPVLLFLALFITIIIISIKTYKKNRFIAFGFLWFFIILLPRTNIFQINRPMYEHWLYLPMLGFWLAIFCIDILLFEKIKKKNINVALFLFYLSFSLVSLFIIGFSVLTILRNNDWQEPIRFYEKNLIYTPNSFIQNNNLGMAYASVGRIEEAIKAYRRALEIKDVYAQVHYNLANSLRDLDQNEEAIREYKKAIEMSPNFQLPYNNLLAIYIKKNNQEEINLLLDKMKIIFSGQASYFYTVGTVYYNLGEYKQAIEIWRKLLKIESNPEIRRFIQSAKDKIK